MSAYVIADVKITDYEKYRGSWQAAAQAVHDRVGGKMLVRTDHPEMLAGSHNGNRIVLLEFQNADNARNWWKEMSGLLTADFMTQQHVMIVEGSSDKTECDRDGHAPVPACPQQRGSEMKKAILLLSAGALVGVGASQFLSAAEGPPVYSVAEINVRDKAAYEKALPEAMSFIKEGGGKYLAGGFDKTHTRTGMPAANRYVIQVYPNKAALDKTWDSGLGAWVEKNKSIADFRVIEAEGVEQK